MVIVVIAAVYTAGAVLQLLGPMMGTLLGTIAAGALAGAAASLVGQGVGMALGVQDRFSWKAVGQSALMGGITAGVTHAIGGTATPGTSATASGTTTGVTSSATTATTTPAWLTTAGRAAITNIASRGIMMALGQQRSFDWRSVAASAAGSAAGSQAKSARYGTFGQGMARGLAGYAVSGGNFQQALPAIVGGAIGDQLVHDYHRPVQSESERKLRTAQRESQQMAQNNTISRQEDGRVFGNLSELRHDTVFDNGQNPYAAGADQNAGAMDALRKAASGARKYIGNNLDSAEQYMMVQAQKLKQGLGKPAAPDYIDANGMCWSPDSLGTRDNPGAAINLDSVDRDRMAATYANSFHGKVAQSTTDGLLMEAGGAAAKVVLAPFIAGGAKVASSFISTETKLQWALQNEFRLGLARAGRMSAPMEGLTPEVMARGGYGANTSVGFTGAGTTKLDAAAEAAYSRIRAQNMTDVEAVANNIGLSTAEATAMKKQLFFGRHEYPLDGTTIVRQRFAADHEIAFAWNSAAKGELSASQQSWLQQLAGHELAERSFMAKGVPYLQQEAWNGARFTGFPKGAHDMAPAPPRVNFPGYETPWHLLD